MRTREVPVLYSITPQAGEAPSQSFARFQVAWLHDRFLANANPVYAWEAYRICYEAKNPVPDWVADYLYASGSAIVNGDPVSEALGLAVKGGHSKLLQAEDAVRDSKIAARVAYLAMLSADDVQPADAAQYEFPMTIDKAFEHVAKEYNLSKDVVRRAYYAHAK